MIPEIEVGNLILTMDKFDRLNTLLKNRDTHDVAATILDRCNTAESFIVIAALMGASESKKEFDHSHTTQWIYNYQNVKNYISITLNCTISHFNLDSIMDMLIKNQAIIKRKYTREEKHFVLDKYECNCEKSLVFDFKPRLKKKK